jgi:hypothetical protein
LRAASNRSEGPARDRAYDIAALRPAYLVRREHDGDDAVLLVHRAEVCVAVLVRRARIGGHGLDGRDRAILERGHASCIRVHSGVVSACEIRVRDVGGLDRIVPDEAPLPVGRQRAEVRQLHLEDELVDAAFDIIREPNFSHVKVHVGRCALLVSRRVYDFHQTLATRIALRLGDDFIVAAGCADGVDGDDAIVIGGVRVCGRVVVTKLCALQGVEECFTAARRAAQDLIKLDGRAAVVGFGP